MGGGRQEAPHSNRRDIENLKKLSTYLWEYRGRVLVALGFLMLSKLAIVAVPLVLKRIINTLDQSGGTAAESLSDSASAAAGRGGRSPSAAAPGVEGHRRARRGRRAPSAH